MEMENHKFNPRCDPTNYNANLAQPNERGEGEYRERRHTHTEKTYSEVTRSSRDNTESTRPAWSSPPPQAKKLETIIQIPNENNPNTVLKEIKQNISEDQIDRIFSRYIYHGVSGTKPGDQDGVRSKYTFITELVEQNPEIKTVLGVNVHSNIYHGVSGTKPGDQDGVRKSTWLQVRVNKIHLNIACIYRPPNMSPKEDELLLSALHDASRNLSPKEDELLLSALHDASRNLDNLVIFGDFNYPSLNWTNPAPSANDSAASLFMNMFLSTNLVHPQYSRPGPDGVHPVFLKNTKSLIGPLTKIMQFSMEEGKLPQQWKESTVIPVYKKGDKFDPKNYRQVSLTSIPCKILEKIISEQLTEFILNNHIIPTSQHGFMPGRSVISNLLECTNNWTLSVDRGNPVDVVYLDFNQWIEGTQWTILRSERETTKLDRRLSLRQRLQGSRLSGRGCRVLVGGEYSERYHASRGVPQGSVLAPLLFNIYTADIALGLNSQISSFADDTKIYNNPVTHFNELASDLQRIERWCKDWLLDLNENKCSILHIGSNNPRRQYTLNNQTIKTVSTQEDLGVVISADLRWAPHIGKVVKRVNSMSYMISRTFTNPSPKLLEKIYKIYIRSIMDHAAVVWSPYLAKDIHALEQTQRKISRLSPTIKHLNYLAKDIHALEQTQRKISRLSPTIKHLNYESRLKILNLTSLSDRRRRGDLIETYKILHGHYNVNLSFFSVKRDDRLRGHNYRIERDRFSRLSRQHFLPNRVAHAWNSLPRECVVSVTSFKTQYDKCCVASD
ncbi:Reverse transcriptase (RNA-dependent DNA polymerase) [Popillia japonica]|uniref:Reverse transcriptase (RNA-dependent DNA polymerase) n=1 Tax=Popillia japonica TaxID=7064 RepID=A0AAW1L1P3_POPJA